MTRTLRHRRAFTIIEMLVVISILVLLIAILLPSMQRAREVARRAVCASNQHELIVATLGYASDYFQALPRENRNMTGDYFEPSAFRGDMLEALALPLKDEHGQTITIDYGGGWADTTQILKAGVFKCPSSPHPVRWQTDGSNVHGSNYGWELGKRWANVSDRRPNLWPNYFYLANTFAKPPASSYEVEPERRVGRVNQATRVPPDRVVVWADEAYFGQWWNGGTWVLNHASDDPEEVEGAMQATLDGSVRWVDEEYPEKLEIGGVGVSNAAAFHTVDGYWGLYWY